MKFLRLQALIYKAFFVVFIAITSVYSQDNSRASVNTTEFGTVISDRIKLNKSEIENLGITFSNNKVHVVTESFYKISKRTSDEFVEILMNKGYQAKSGICRFNVSIDPVSILPDEEPLVYDNWNMTKGTILYPVAITVEYSKNSNGNNKSNLSAMYVAGNSPILKELPGGKTFKWENKRFIPRINKILPVTFEYETGSANKTTLRIHFWYVATKQLIDKLPDRYKEGIMKEIGIINDINNGNLTIENGCEQANEYGEYFDICQSGSGALGGINVFPHPVVTNARCRLFLKESRMVSVALYDGGGAMISNILTNQLQPAGNNDFDIPFDEMSSGIYIIVVVTNKNERISTKIIVNK